MAAQNIREVLAARKAQAANKAPVKPAPKKAEPVEPVDDDLVVDDGQEPEPEEEVVVKPEPKKAANKAPVKPVNKKPPVKKPEPEPEEEEPTDDDLVVDDGQEPEPEEEEVVVKPEPKKAANKAPVKKPEEKPEPKKAPPKNMFAKKQTTTEEKVYAPGSWLPRDVFLGRFVERLRSVNGFEGITRAQVETLVSEFEEFTVETLENHDIKIFGVKTKQSVISARIYQPKDLERVQSPYHTLVDAHVKRSIVLTEPHGRCYGTLNDDGEFVEGRFDEKGNFEEGTWINKATDEFTPKNKKPAQRKK